MGHSIHYRTDVGEWGKFSEFLERVAYGIGYDIEINRDTLMVDPHHPLVEPLVIKKKGVGFAKTNLIEPHHSIYLLIIHSVSFFGSVELWED
ncbi:TonB-dependent receptor [Thermococcus sp.]